MNIPEYKLFRQIITPEWRRNDPWIKAHETHLISIQCIINGDTHDSNYEPLEPWQLKAVVNMMKDTIINAANQHYGETVVTSIG